MEFQQIKEWANNPMVCISGLVKENIDTLIAAVESLTAEKETRQEDVFDLQERVTELEIERQDDKSSLAQAREKINQQRGRIAFLEGGTTYVDLQTTLGKLEAAEQREKGLKEALEGAVMVFGLWDALPEAAKEVTMRKAEKYAKAALAAASKEETDVQQ